MNTAEILLTALLGLFVAVMLIRPFAVRRSCGCPARRVKQKKTLHIQFDLTGNRKLLQSLLFQPDKGETAGTDTVFIQLGEGDNINRLSNPKSTDHM